MAAAKKESAPEVVLTQFAYATGKSGEVVQLVKGDVVDSELFTPESLDHLPSIGFVGTSE